MGGNNMSVINITNGNFKKEVLESTIPVLLDFWAPWCGPCRMLSPVVDKIAESLGSKAKVGKINVDEETELASHFKIMSIPTLVVIKNGIIVHNSVGVVSSDKILEMLAVS
jgi:thioredoxin 1